MTNTPIKIFVDAHVFDGHYQGTRTFIKELYCELANNPDIKLYLAANDVANLQNNFPALDNITFLSYKSKSRYKRLFFEIPALIKQHRVDYAHFQYVSPLRKHCPYIVSTHDVLFYEMPSEFPLAYRLKRKYMFKMSAEQADLLTTVSTHAKTVMSKNLQLKEREVHVIPNGVNPNLFALSDKPASLKYIADKYNINKFLLLVSRIEPRKNHLLLLQSFFRLQLHVKGYHLVFIGNPSISCPALKKALENLSKEEREHVLILPSVSEDELIHFYQAASLFVYPSKGEGFGIPPLEAAAMETPVICSKASALAAFDFFEDDHINTDDEESLDKRILKWVDGSRDEVLLKERAIKIKEQYSWKSSADKLYEMIMTHYSNNKKQSIK